MSTTARDGETLSQTTLGATDETASSGATIVNSWHPLAVASSIGDTPQRAVLLDEPLVLFRSSTGVAALRDLCIHRGVPLSLGTVTPAGNIRCAYHGWEYDGSGTCVRIPSRPAGSSIPSKARASKIWVAEAHGLVWGALERPHGPLPDWPLSVEGGKPFREVICPGDDFQTSAGRVIDNFLDISHLPFVHGGILADAEPRPIPRYEVIAEPDGFYFERYETEPGSLHSGDSSEMIHWEYFLSAPYVAHIKKSTASGRTTVITVAAAPVSAKVTKAFFVLSRNYDTDPAQDHKYLDHHYTLSAQDRRIIEQQRPEQIPTDLREELHIRDIDAASLAYRRILSRYGVEKSELP